ncbi:ScaI family restriction endonuclease [Paenibacillus abyssi]|uniref:Restriction endonuclease n=1 Tax=Paenibacillus abyssi TaxID=1340531 RepID=A0A917D2B6_9BACL|nr:ScaI family restriction endonuclease [Paenibacillus abyssi]GGG05387.1 hypothetical protein GCM10010916_23070 [Paenibacillus abyssi]
MNSHPLKPEDIVEAVLESWEGILTTKIAGELQLGVDVFPVPQIMGSFLHELIPVKLSKKYPASWRRERDKGDKDLVYIPEDFYSIEIKTSSNKTNIFGNRSYGQENSENNSGKSKSGFYITINFEKFEDDIIPEITKVRFGWIDHSDWKAQKSATGQQASLSKEARDYKLLLLYEKEKTKKKSSVLVFDKGIMNLF